MKGALSALCADCSGELALPVAGFGKAGDVSTAGRRPRSAASPPTEARARAKLSRAIGRFASDDSRGFLALFRVFY
jgi:hypothetical protein